MGIRYFSCNERTVNSFPKMIRYILLLALAFVCVYAAPQAAEPKADDCLHCVEDIVKAVTQCTTEGTTTLECIENALGVASDCLVCICEVLSIIGGGDGICP